MYVSQTGANVSEPDANHEIQRYEDQKRMHQRFDAAREEARKRSEYAMSLSNDHSVERNQ